MTTLPKATPTTPEEDALAEEQRARETRELSAVDLDDVPQSADVAGASSHDTPQAVVPAADAIASAPQRATQSTGAQPDGDADGDATMLRPAVQPMPDATIVRPAIEPRPRKNTLANAITPPLGRVRDEATSAPPLAPQLPTGVADEIEGEVDEWAVADQPTVYLVPQPQTPSRPAYLETGENQAWPARPTPPPPTRPRAPEQQRSPLPQTPRPPAGSRPDSPLARQQRLASPAGRPMPGTPPIGVPRAALPDPRMSRFQTLRQQRLAHEGGERAPSEPPSVASAVRQWWSDLLPNLEHALTYQREARASGLHPIPAYEPTPVSRLGDAFGRLAATARDLTGRAQAAASPTLKRLHNQAEQAAQAIVDKIEGPTARQQAPLLGPGRVAVFFRQGVTIGQAQALLSASHARPIRLIPRKHGFLTLVTPGMEAEIGERLREHPYVRDVAYLQYDDYGHAIEPR